MVITTKHVNESQIEEIAGLIQNGQSMIGLDRNDVKTILMGKEGILYQAVQDEGVDNSTFMRDFFNELKKERPSPLLLVYVNKPWNVSG